MKSCLRTGPSDYFWRKDMQCASNHFTAISLRLACLNWFQRFHRLYSPSKGPGCDPILSKPQVPILVYNQLAGSNQDDLPPHRAVRLKTLFAEA